MADLIKHMRLNPNKEDEAKAIAIIQKAEETGIDFKGLVLPLILDLEGFRFDSPLALVNELLVSIEEVKEAAEILKKAGAIKYVQQAPEQAKREDDTISGDDILVQSLKGKARTGRRK